MLLRKYRSIMEKPEDHRNKWALGLSVALTILIFISFAFYRGYFSFGGEKTIARQKPDVQLASVASVPSPIQSTKSAFMAAFDEVNKQYQEFKDSLSNVFVPFVTGIEVYERER